MIVGVHDAENDNSPLRGNVKDVVTTNASEPGIFQAAQETHGEEPATARSYGSGIPGEATIPAMRRIS